MSDPEHLPRHPAPTYQTPDWETPTHPKKWSFIDRMAPSVSLGSSRLSYLRNQRRQSTATGGDIHNKETLMRLPTQTSSISQGGITPVQPSWRSRFDAIVPPNRTYFGRTRRFFLLAVVLPIAVLLLFILPLALGLGLSKRNSDAHKALPLPAIAGQVYTGDLTFYTPALGACGLVSTSEEAVCAVSHYTWDAVQQGGNPNTNPLCGLKLRVTRNAVELGGGNRTIDVTVVDRCEACEPNDIDLSPKMFNELALEQQGRVKATWSWL
jgi:hypothetical protein